MDESDVPRDDTPAASDVQSRDEPDVIHSQWTMLPTPGNEVPWCRVCVILLLGAHVSVQSGLI